MEKIYFALLTLKRPTSGRPCQGQGGLQEPLLSNLALERHRAPKTHFPESWDHFQFIRAIFRIFFAKSRKKLQNYRYSTIWPKNCEKFQVLQFLRYINNIYIKRMHFPSGIQFWAEKIWFVEKKWKKLIFSGFWSKIMLTSWLQRQFFCNWWKKFQKWLSGLEMKSHQIWARYL